MHLLYGGCADSAIGGYGDEGCYSIATTKDMGFVIAGYTRSRGAGGSDFWLLKYGPKTGYLTEQNRGYTYAGYYWNRTYGGPEDDFAKCVIETNDGGFAIAGYVTSVGNGLDIWLIKTDSEGNIEWDVSYGGIADEVANSLIQTDDGGYVLAGYIGFGVSKNTLLVKMDKVGMVEWDRILPGHGCNQVIKTSDGGYALAVSYPDAFGLVITNSSGRTQLKQRFPGPVDLAEAQSLVQADDGGYFVAGWTQNSGLRTYGTLLVRTSAHATVQWERSWDGVGVWSMIRTHEGNYAMTGDRACIIVIDPEGNLLYRRMLSGESEYAEEYYLRCYSITETIENHFYMAGIDRGPDGSKGHYLLANAALSSDETKPIITVLSPESGVTYPSDYIPLTFLVSKPSTSFMYRLDGKNKTISGSGNITLPTLEDGQHSIAVYARDTSQNIGVSDEVSFSVDNALTVDKRDGNPPDNPSGTMLDSMQVIAIPSSAALAATLVALTIRRHRKHENEASAQN